MIFLIIALLFVNTVNAQTFNLTNFLINDTQPSVNQQINIKLNISSVNTLSICQLYHNMSGVKTYINTSLSGNQAICSFNLTITGNSNDIVNITLRVNDSTGAVKTTRANPVAFMQNDSSGKKATFVYLDDGNYYVYDAMSSFTSVVFTYKGRYIIPSQFKYVNIIAGDIRYDQANQFDKRYFG